MSKKQGQRLIPEYLLKYIEVVETNIPDPNDIGEGGGSTYTAGIGIDIDDNNEISAKLQAGYGIVVDDDLDTGAKVVMIDDEDIPSYSDLSSVATSGDYDDLINKPVIPDTTNFVTTNTNQTISGTKTLEGNANTVRLTIDDTTQGSYDQLKFTPEQMIVQGNLGTTTSYGKDGVVVSGSSNEFEISYLGTNKTYTFDDSKGGEVATTDEIITSYNDLTDKPTIPTISGTNDGTNWTSITINSDTYDIPSGGSSVTITTTTGSESISDGTNTLNVATRDTAQDITGKKTFVGNSKLDFKCSSSNDILGFTARDENGYEFGSLQARDRTVGVNTNKYITLGNYSLTSTTYYSNKAKVGFRIQPTSSSNNYNFIMPYGTNTDFTTNGYSTSSDNTIPCAFTNGTTTVNADATGLVNINSLLQSETWTFTLSDNTTVTKNVVIK